MTISGKPQVAEFIRREDGFPACKVKINGQEWTVKPEEVQDSQQFLASNKLIIDLTRLKTNTRKNVSEATGINVNKVREIVLAAKGVGLLA